MCNEHNMKQETFRMENWKRTGKRTGKMTFFFFNSEDSQALKQVAQRGYNVSLHPWRISGPHWIKPYTIWSNLTDDPACNRRWKYISPEILPAWIILWSCVVLKSKCSLFSDDTNLFCSLRVPVLWPVLCQEAEKETMRTHCLQSVVCSAPAFAFSPPSNPTCRI